MLLFIMEGQLTFRMSLGIFTANAPCLVCFDETENPVILQKRRLRCHCVLFHPQFLNVNMRFSLIRSQQYGDIAHTHDMFLLKPFLDKKYIIPAMDSYLPMLAAAFSCMKNELEIQRDWYWSCRARSYFMEIMISLERLYGLIDNNDQPVYANYPLLTNERMKSALLFVESHFSEDISFSLIQRAAGLNHTTLSQVFFQETGFTPMEYVWRFRVSVAKKHLAFTNIPLKDVAVRCGFKTVQHFSRVFKEQTGQTPATYRREKLEKRMAAL